MILFRGQIRDIPGTKTGKIFFIKQDYQGFTSIYADLQNKRHVLIMQVVNRRKKSVFRFFRHSLFIPGRF